MTVINLGLVCAAAAYLVIGILWYSPYVLGIMWKKISGKEAIKGGWLSFVLDFVAALVMAIVLNWILAATGTQSLLGAVKRSALMWLGFVATTSIGSVIWRNKSLNLYIINNLYQLAAITVMGIILFSLK